MSIINTRPDILPKPDRDSQLQSEILLDQIMREISKKGAITFARYMEMALYEPGLGYYTAGNPKFGREGDFVTAPEISSLFARCIARPCEQVLKALGKHSVILELGAGSGKMASQILKTLEKAEALPDFYWILDLSADLKNRQKALLEKEIPHLLHKVKWLDSLPQTPFEGVILANEVLDAMPVHRFKQEESLQEFYVQAVNGKLEWKLDQPSDPNMINLIAPLRLPYGYISEINLTMDPWVQALSQNLKKGILWVTDYGYPEEEYYHPQRTHGTLTCYYRHRSHDNPLILTGIQDITAHVNFSALGKAGIQHGFQQIDYTNQANFLINCGLANLMTFDADPVTQFKINQAVKQLLMPGEMGELFKVMALSKNIQAPLLGFHAL